MISMILRIFRWIFYSLIILLILFISVAWYYHEKDYSDYFHQAKGELSGVKTLSSDKEGSRNKNWVTLLGDGGQRVELGVLAPRKTGKRYPVLVVLGGKATGKYAVNYAFGVEEAIVVAVDYPFEPKKKYTVRTFIKDLPAIRRALFEVVPSTMLALDYVWSRDDVDTTKIALLGFSFGAPFVPCVLSHDRRPALGVMVYGGGDLRSLISHNARRYHDYFLSDVVGLVGSLFLLPLEPLEHVEKVSPIPLVMINGSQDEQIPRRNVEVLFAKAREPKKIIWIESRHLGPLDPGLTLRVIKTVRDELVQRGILGGS